MVNIEMKVSAVLLLLFAGSVHPDMAGECDMAAFYLELGCQPAPGDNSTACPEAFVCPDLHPDPNLCYYRGVSYKSSEMIPESLVQNPCSIRCFCNLIGDNNRPQFRCAAIDCPEFFDSDEKQQCINTYQLDECCSTGKVCGKDAIAKLSTCEVDGQVYLEGQTFEPKNTHKRCICSPQWNGSTDNCVDINCGIEIHNQNELMNRCAPMFPTSLRQCPFEFICQAPTSKVIRGLNVEAVNAQCFFGNMTLAVGDQLAVDKSCTTCKCQVPPFVTCVKQTACNN